jgi:Type IV secretion system pilin
MTRKLALTLTGVVLVALVASPLAFAAPADLNQVISNLSTWITALLAALATLMVLIGGVRFIFAAGDPSMHEKAKGAIRTALIGYALALLAPVLTSIVQQIVG